MALMPVRDTQFYHIPLGQISVVQSDEGSKRKETVIILKK